MIYINILVDHIDITQLEDIKITFPPRYTNAYTIGFWMFVENETSFGDNLINITMEGRLMISVGMNTHISSICNMHMGRYHELTTITSMAAMTPYLSGSNFVNKQTEFTADPSGKWFHVRCGYSLDKQYLYNMMTVKDNATPVVQEDNSVHDARYYDAMSLDFQFLYFWGSTTSLSITNAKSITKAVYLKHMQIFSEIIPKVSGVNYL